MIQMINTLESFIFAACSEEEKVFIDNIDKNKMHEMLLISNLTSNAGGTVGRTSKPNNWDIAISIE